MRTTKQIHTADLQKQTEKQFQAQVIRFAQMCGWHVYHPFLSVRSGAGFPDLVLVRGEEVIFAELKTDKGRISPAQDEWLGALMEVRRVHVHVWRPSSWPVIEAMLQRTKEATR